LPRIAAVMLVLVTVAVVAVVNAVGLSGVDIGGLVWGIDRFGPPLASAVVAALANWIAPAEVPVSAFELVVRMSAWAVAAVALLVVVFRRQDIGK
jgi:hypothetical protein